FERPAALKVLREQHHADPDSRRRFLQEARITALLEHPGIVPVHALAQASDGRPCYVMRFVKGQSLQDAIQAFHLADRPRRGGTQPRLALQTLLNRFIAVCNTVAYAHSQGVLHRDIKPANIMLGPYGETQVLDWGLAKPFRGDNAIDGDTGAAEG